MGAAVTQVRRRLSTVLVEGLEELGFTLARHLISAGIGTVLLCDESPVTGAENSYRSLDEGRPRAEAALSLLEDPGGTSVLAEAPEGAITSGVDLRVLCVSTAALDALGQHPEALRYDCPILPVLHSPGGPTGVEIRIGPLLNLPSGPCLGCLLRHRQSSTVPSSPEPPSPGTDSPVLPVIPAAAALAAWQVLVLIDGRHSADMETSGWLLQAEAGELMQFQTRQHPDCPCLTQHR